MGDRELKEVKRLLRRVLRIGKVVGVDAEKCSARVEFPDNENIVTCVMPVLQAHSLKDKFYSLPSIDEFVLCAFLPVGIDTGFILGSYYSDSEELPASDAAKFNITFEDGTVLEYDKQEHILTADIKGAANITCEKDITIKSEGNVSIECKEAKIKADSVLVEADVVNLGGEDGKGVVTQECFCALTGSPHPEASSIVNGVK